MVLLERAATVIFSQVTSSYFTIALTILLTILSFLIWRVRAYLKSVGPNPFVHDSRRVPQPIILDRTARDKIIKQGFTAKKVPVDLDAIVIGSGIGGLSTAALLARVGKKVLVLEQHDQAGGCCHSFVDKGMDFICGLNRFCLSSGGEEILLACRLHLFSYHSIDLSHVYIAQNTIVRDMYFHDHCLVPRLAGLAFFAIPSTLARALHSCLAFLQWKQEETVEEAALTVRS